MQVRLLSQLLFWGRRLALFLRALGPRWLMFPIVWPLARILNVCPRCSHGCSAFKKSVVP